VRADPFVAATRSDLSQHAAGRREIGGLSEIGIPHCARAPQRMTVGVNKSRHHHKTISIDDLGGCSAQFQNLGAVTDGEDAPIADRK
jgi:hypothetical protein